MPIRFQVDPDFYDHPKTIQLSDSAVALWTRAGSYAAGKLTDGFIPDVILATLSKSATASASELTKARLWRRVRGGYRFHQWEHRNLTRERIEAERKADRDRKKAPSKGNPGKSSEITSPQVKTSNDTRDAHELATSDHRDTNETATKPQRRTNRDASGNGAQPTETEILAGHSASVPTGIRPESDRNPGASVSVSLSVSESLKAVPHLSSASDDFAPPRLEDEPRSRIVSMGAAKLSRIYCDKVRLSDRGKVSMVITNATAAGYTDDQISAALLRLASDNMPVTADTLRIEIDGKKAPNPFGISTDANGVIRAASGRPIAGKGWEE